VRERRGSAAAHRGAQTISLGIAARVLLFCSVWFLCFLNLCVPQAAPDKRCPFLGWFIGIFSFGFLNVNRPFPKKGPLVGSSTPELPARTLP